MKIRVYMINEGAKKFQKSTGILVCSSRQLFIVPSILANYCIALSRNDGVHKCQG